LTMFLGLTSCGHANFLFWLNAPTGRTNHSDPRYGNIVPKPPIAAPSTTPGPLRVLATYPGKGNANYGCWDGRYFWIGNFGTSTISRVGRDGTYDTYSLTPTGASEPLQLAFDGHYVWVACADADCSLVKFDPSANQPVATYTYNRANPKGPYGGIQGVTWDGSELWIGLNQGYVFDVNPANGAVLKEADYLDGAGGITVMYQSGVKYLYVSCNLVIAKINTQTMAVQKLVIPNSPGNLFRLTNDGTYVYAASFTINGPGAVVKLDPVTGAILASWGNSDSIDLNDICLDHEGRLWVAGDNGMVSAVDKNSGIVVAQFPGAGVSTVVLGASEEIWSVNWKTADLISLIGR
jgi:streptogramin lyase